ncbi:secernin-3 [Lingula anatina]|uniref:Secernin-3 n=1 Tax=Lingula anatina TaxID=7574 RepID=A0A1S3HJS6_LINAN|nr:secernin-3 [Lingula anatina]XP_013385242.1 secernin-3 [Lingula anatina]XP_013385244.1 secernin-3 [Lingula anatina]|eukprot:XP_013385241.1 secernin-3 [Lingula anatina]
MAKVLLGCDTFVALPPATEGGGVVFGKNSDRPEDEVQEVVSLPAADHPAGSKLQCTYIEIEQVPHTYAVVLSKPAWMWGAEMGANEHGVCIGNEAIWSKIDSESEERLQGMDLVRLGLERGKTAKEAMDIMTALLEKHGQGGPSFDDADGWTYHNSYIIADRSEAWVLETVDRIWVAEHITSGVRNISNELSIRTKMDAKCSSVEAHAQENGLWKPETGPLDFAKVYSDMTPRDPVLGVGRYGTGRKLMQKYSEKGTFNIVNMMTILRDERSGICMGTGAGFVSAGSQVSFLPPPGSPLPACHWFTATPDPEKSIYKPYVFSEENAKLAMTTSKDYGAEDPVRVKPRFQSKVDRKHPLYKSHEKFVALLEKEDPKGIELAKNIKELEMSCIGDVKDILDNFDEKSVSRLSGLFNKMVQLEINFYDML